MATGDSGSDSWLSLSATSGTDSGSGSTITINGNAGSLAPGSYSGQVTVSANNNGMVLQGSPQTVKVTIVVSGYTVSGTALACNGPSPTCTTSQGLGDATVALINSSSNTVETVTADSSGNFTLTNVAPGTYTISASGSSNSTAYSGTVTVTVSADTTNVSVSTFSS
jgi:hypothetical protein